MSMMRRRLLDDTVQKTAEGEDIVVRSVARMRPGLTIYGKSWQQTTTGAQLLNPGLYHMAGTINGITIKNNSDGSITASGTPTIESGYIFTHYLGEYIDILQDGKTYITNMSLRIETDEGGEYSTRVTVDKSTMSSIEPYFQRSVETYKDGETVYPILNEGNEIAQWESYTGGKPSPSPDYPQEIVSHGDDGEIKVVVAGANIIDLSKYTDGKYVSKAPAGTEYAPMQSLIVSTPNGLPGIPVTSTGNYTDENGQHWTCDEIDFKHGKYVRRVQKESLKGTPDFNSTPDVPGRYIWPTALKNAYKTGDYASISNFAKWNEWGRPNSALGDTFCVSATVIYYSPLNDDKSVEEINEMFAEMIASDDPPYVITQLSTPVETDLTPEQITAYQSLHTNYPTTTVVNDEGARMKLTYKTRKSLEVTN